MARRRYTRRSGGKADGGSSWISYSDMMAALLLLFVLFLCYSVYQYFLMLETKTAELDAQSALLHSQQATLDVQQITLEEQEIELAEKEAAIVQREAELEDALAQVDEQQAILDAQSLRLNEQQATLDAQSLTLDAQQQTIIAGEKALAAKEKELEASNAQLELREAELDKASIKLDEQQQAMDLQQKRIDDLVGVRTKIVADLTSALAAANLKAKVDPNTGDIMLESTVFFDVAKSDIKPEGKAFLERFIPVYLSVLLSDEYADYVGEIIIEGHTDTQGSYLSNLELSQQRALSVASFCLEIPGLTDEQRAKFREMMTATGKSFSNPIYNGDGTVNMDASRRVEFKFRMKDSEMIDEIRKMLASDE